jgi:hypothetical protein
MSDDHIPPERQRQQVDRVGMNTADDDGRERVVRDRSAMEEAGLASANR